MQVMDKVGVTIVDSAAVNAIETKGGRTVPANADYEEPKERALGTRLFQGTNNNYSGYLTHLRNSYLDGKS